MSKNYNFLNHIKDIEVFIDKDLTGLTTMKLKSTGDLVLVRTVEALSLVVRAFQSQKMSYHILGMGANTLLPVEAVRPYIKLDFHFDLENLNGVKEFYELPASLTINLLTNHAIKFGLKGWESFTGVPATLGGAIFMNAGTGLGEIGKLVHSVDVMGIDGVVERRILDFKRDFAYRKNLFLKEGEIIVAATLIHQGLDPEISKKIRDYLIMRNNSQPLKEKTCGCVFKNHTKLKSGQSIDLLGLKYLRINGIQVSGTHANFMENKGTATYEDVQTLIKIIQDEVYLNFGVHIEIEAQ